jgi:hypothetical protein
MSEIFANGSNGFRHAHSRFGGSGGLDDWGHVWLVSDLEHFGETRDLVGLQIDINSVSAGPA